METGIEPGRPEDALEQARSRCLDRAASLFARDGMTLEVFERLASEIAHAESESSLQAIESKLPAEPHTQIPEVQHIDVRMSKSRLQGEWIESPRVAVAASMSNLRFDLTEYASKPSFRVQLDLDLSHSNLKITVPSNIEVIDRLSSSTMSTVRNRGNRWSRSGSGRTLVITGRMVASTLKIKHRSW